jgi:hypothetical protein
MGIKQGVILTGQDVLLLALLVLVLSEAGSGSVVFGMTYHVCDCGPGAASGCIPGDDTVTITSPQLPWRSFSMARRAFPGLVPGDTIAFCQGGSFVADGGPWLNYLCRAGKTCTISNYSPPWGKGGEGKPLIVTPADKTAFLFANSGTASHREGYVVSNMELRGTGASGVGFFFYNDIDDVTLENLVITGFGLGVHVAGSNPPGPGSNGANDRVILRNSRVADNAGQGWLGSCDGCAILNNTFDNNGFKGPILYHNIYWDGSSKSSGGRIVGNSLTRSTLINSKCQGVSLVIHGDHRNLVIENNTISEERGAAAETCWGIAADTAYSSAEGFRNVIIRNNRVQNVGNVGIGINACTDCVIEGNHVIMGQPFGTTAIAAPDRPRGTEDLPMARVTIRNNIISVNNHAAQTGIVLGGEGTGHISTGNVTTYFGENPGWSCFSYPLPLASYQAIDENICHFPRSSSGRWEKVRGTLTQWRAFSGFDLSSSQ